MNYNYLRPGIGNASSYIASGIPWYTSSLAPALSTTSVVVNLPQVTKFVTIKNTSTTGDSLRFTFNNDSVVDSTNYVLLESGESFSADFRVTDIHLISDSETPVPFTIVNGLTNIRRQEMTSTTPVPPNLLDWVQKQKLVADDPDGSPEGDNFGRSLVSFVDGNTKNLLISAYFDEGPNGEYRGGSVYRFAEIDGKYQQIEKLPYPPEIGDPTNKRWGIIEGYDTDGKKTIYRIISEQKMYLYESGSNGYQITQEIQKPGFVVPPWFGSKVSFSENTNTLLLCNGTNSTFGSFAGMALIYQTSSLGYQFSQLIEPSYNTDGSPTQQGENQQFGFDCAMSRDGNAAFIGSSGDSEAGSFAGAVYIFQSSSLGYEQVQKITASYNTDGTPETWKAGGVFGYSLALTPDSQILAVGAVGNDEKAADNGAVYIFRSGSSGYEQVQKITASFDTKGNTEAPQQSHNFGADVQISDDYSVLSVFPSQDQEDGGGGVGLASGAIYIFHSGSEGYYQVKKITGSLNTDGTPEVPTSSEFFGNSHLLSSDGKTLIASGYKNDENGTDAGAAYVFKYTRDY